MAFEGLSEKLNGVFKRLKSRGKLSEADVKEAMREVKMALLEADVSYKVVKDFIAKVTERSVGEEVLKSLTPGQQVIKIVNDELIKLMGEANSKINFPNKPPCIIMMSSAIGRSAIPSPKTTTYFITFYLCLLFYFLINKQSIISASFYAVMILYFTRMD